MNEPIVTTISAENPLLLDSPTPPSQEQLESDFGYHKAQELLGILLDEGYISPLEYNKITLLNRQTFSPYLSEIMPNIR